LLLLLAAYWCCAGLHKQSDEFYEDMTSRIIPAVEMELTELRVDCIKRVQQQQQQQQQQKQQQQTMAGMLCSKFKLGAQKLMDKVARRWSSTDA
jgi:hypothetical protein